MALRLQALCSNAGIGNVGLGKDSLHGWMETQQMFPLMCPIVLFQL